MFEHHVAQSVPVSMTVLHLMAKGLEKAGPMIKLNHACFADAKHVLLLPGLQNTDNRFRSVTTLVAFYQATVLAVLSMHESIFIPAVASCTEEDGTISITWKGGIADHIRWGYYDDNMAQFEKTVLLKVFGYQEASEPFLSVRLTHYLERIMLYSINLEVCYKRIDSLLVSPDKANQIFKKDMSADLLFILLACFPMDTMNQLFSYIYEFFPEDLNVRTQDGNTVNVERLFQSPSSDIQFLLQKIMIYHDLYFGPDLPIIKEITRVKTTEFMLKLVNNPPVFNEIKGHLKNIQDQQIQTRLSLYSLFTSRLEALLTPS